MLVYLQTSLVCVAIYSLYNLRLFGVDRLANEKKNIEKISYSPKRIEDDFRRVEWFFPFHGLLTF